MRQKARFSNSFYQPSQTIFVSSGMKFMHDGISLKKNPLAHCQMVPPSSPSPPPPPPQQIQNQTADAI